jgi:aldehyde oxidoreductase
VPLGVACLATGRPLSLVYSQFQNITYTGKRSPGNAKIKLGADEAGKLVAMETDWWIDHGPYLEFGDLLTVRPGQFTGAGYGINNIRGKGRTVCTNRAWDSPFRTRRSNRIWHRWRSRGSTCVATRASTLDEASAACGI